MMQCRTTWYSLATTVAVALALVWLGLAACQESEEAPRHEIPVVADGGSLDSVDTDRGWTVEFDAVEMRLRDLEFTVGGETHDDSEVAWRRVYRTLVPTAVAHPNHSAGGQVGGTLDGPVVARFEPGQTEPLGVGTFLEGDYAGYDLTVAAGASKDDTENGLDADSLIRLEATAWRDDTEIAFVVDVNDIDTTTIWGGALSMGIPDEDINAVAIEFSGRDSWSDRTIFDGIDFSEFQGQSDEPVEIDDTAVAYARIRSAVTAHEYYGGRPVMDR